MYANIVPPALLAAKVPDEKEELLKQIRVLSSPRKPLDEGDEGDRLSKKEFRKLLAKLGSSLSGTRFTCFYCYKRTNTDAAGSTAFQANALFHDIDKDHSGYVGKDEFIDAVKGLGFGFDPNTVAELYLEQQRGVIEHRFFQRYCKKLAVQEHSLANQALEGEQHVTGQEPRKTSKYLNVLRRFYSENPGTITRMSVESLSQVLPDATFRPDIACSKGFTALMHATNAGLAEMRLLFLRVIVELISMGADVNAASRHGYTPLMLSARAGVARTFSDVHFLGGKPF